MNQNKINLAFLGCGFATHLHSKTLAGFKEDIHCFYASRNAKRAQEYQQKYNGSGFYDSYEKAIHAQDIDVVLVATPPVTHFDLTMQALEAGKHVIVEKPPFLNSKDFAKIQKTAVKSGKHVFVAENYFYKPALKHLQELIQSGIIGEILFVHINALKEQKIKDWRGDTSLSGGGALFEGGIHWINFIANLGLTIKSVKGYRPGKNEGMEKSMLVSLEYEEGAVGSFYYSWETPSLFKGLRISKIYGRQGSITFESNGIFIFVRGKKKRLIFPGLKDIAGYKGMFTDFIAALQAERQATFTLELARRDLELIERIYASI